MTRATARRVYRDTITTERVAQVVLLLVRNPGKRFSTAEIAAYVSMTNEGAWHMLGKISRVAPLSQESGGWMLVLPPD